MLVSVGPGSWTFQSAWHTLEFDRNLFNEMQAEASRIIDEVVTTIQIQISQIKVPPDVEGLYSVIYNVFIAYYTNCITFAPAVNFPSGAMWQRNLKLHPIP